MSRNNDYEQPELFEQEEIVEPEVCLGMHFNSTEERREYFRNLLRGKLKDPEFRKIEGFPIGEDEDIIALSDPPYYCACPNPWMQDIINEWESQKGPETEPYKREPFAADVSEGKNHPIYNAHSYHTKVPHRAIMRYILHYTNPGDIVFDGFCGTGMTGVAAQLCGNKEEVEALGYYVDASGVVFKKEIEHTHEKLIPFSKLGPRKVVLNDLSTVASFISYNYNSATDISLFMKEATSIIEQTEKELGWMYKTRTFDGKEGIINHTVWSDVFICPECGGEVVFYKQAVNPITGKVSDSFLCPHCQSQLTKKMMSRATITKFDTKLNSTITMSKQVPVLINFSIDKKRFDKEPDSDDLELIDKIERIDVSCWYPINELPDGYNTKQPKMSHGITYVHQFYTKRNLMVLSKMRSLASLKLTHFWLDSLDHGLGKRVKYGKFSFPMSTLTGTLYLPSVSKENNPLCFYPTRQKKIYDIFSEYFFDYGALSCCSSTMVNIATSTIDYLFLDPPFGANLNYSELNYCLESWLKVKTNNKEEAIENKVQNKGIFEYYSLMKQCFAEAFRVLKPGHWMTVEFSNTDSSVWNSIQTALAEVGFIVANVSALDKQIGSFKAVTTTAAVKQDLVISLYKPDENFEKQVVSAVGVEAVWNFVRRHLSYLPLVKKQGESVITVPERDPRIIYDRMVSYFVGHNMLIPIDSPDFLAEMPKRFAERNGLYYLEDQVQEYDKLVAKQQIKALDNESMDLFVTDETSAINWVRAQLKNKPMTLGEMTPLFMQQLDSWNKNEKRLELRDILEQNFLCYDAKEEVPSFIHGWLSTMYKDLRNLSKSDKALQEKAKGRWYVPDPNKASDLEKIRDKALLKEFELYKQSKGKLKEFRIEAIRVGFKKAWQEKDYQLIKSIAERMPQSVIEEDEKLLMWYNMAVSRLG